MSTHPVDEKADEKRYEKDEKERSKHEEKSVEEKYRRDPLSTMAWALILIFAGIVLVADNIELLHQINWQRLLPPAFSNIHPQPWEIIMIGAAIILLIEAVIRLLMPVYRTHVGGTVVIAAVMIGIAIGSIFGNWLTIMPLILIGIGITILLRSLIRSR